MNNPWIICDLDGTLSCIHPKRLPFALVKDWEKFHSMSWMDACNKPIVEIIWGLTKRSYNPFHLAIITGRCESTENQTRAWLSENLIAPNELHMRSIGDHRKDVAFKKDIWANYFINRNCPLAFDDRDSSVQLWRSLGLICCQVNTSAY